MTVLALSSSRKGDLEFIEIIMVLVVVVVLIVVGLIIYYNVFSGKVGEAGKRVSEAELSVLVNVLDSMPEVQCNVRSFSKDCVDVVKLSALKSVVSSDKAYFFPVFGFKTVRFEQLYPVPSRVFADGECTNTAFQNPDYPQTCGNWTVYSNPKPRFVSRQVVKTPVVLHNPIFKTYSLGMVYVEVFS